MKKHIKPVYNNQMVRVNRRDIKTNLKSIKEACDSLEDLKRDATDNIYGNDIYALESCYGLELR